MIELSHHILDIGENSLRAGAKNIFIEVRVDEREGFLTLEITDDGHGMTEEEKGKALDPFYTTKKVRQVGLGLPMLAQAAERTGGMLTLESEPGKGTKVTAKMGLKHIDRQPLGDVGGAICALIAGNPSTRLVYRHQSTQGVFEMDTAQIEKELSGIPMNHPEVLNFIRKFVNSNVKELCPEG
ncbi:MAG TPA: sensor histidine kinase [Syntrophales bacterium]|nr:sensor histidine kinase [Syntrophales bacterium]HOL59808.1 sensor histidine kinase [Syntrophales bacterium]HPO35974.1 sensor histidine kinase [Syntrophales bacterium]